MAFVKRLIDLEFKKAKGSFDGSSKDTLRLSGLRVHAKITRAGGSSFGQLRLNVYGLTQSHMNSISTLGAKIQFVPQDTVSVFTGDEDKGAKNLAFKGKITSATANFDSMPSVDMTIEAQTEYNQLVAKADQLSFSGDVDVATVCKQLADAMKLKFENSSNVSVQLKNEHLSGSALNQLKLVCQHANISYDISNGVLAIWPKLGFRQTTGGIPLISAKTGMQGYPTYTSWGIVVRSIYRPDVEFGKKIRVETDLKSATGSQWVVYTMDHDINAVVPNGLWQSTFSCYDPAFGDKVAGR